MAILLVIGYGNELRGDDAIGPRLARKIAGWNIPGVRGLPVHQLVPELAEEMSRAETVIFADASLDVLEEAVSFMPVNLAPVSDGLGHVGSPHSLLALTQAVYGRVPSAWWLRITARQMDFGGPLSPAAEQGITAALAKIRGFLDRADKGENPSPARDGSPCTK